MITKSTIIDTISISRSGNVLIRCGLMLMENGVEIDCKWHRMSIDPGGDVDTCVAAVNDSLMQLGRPTLQPTDIERIRAVVKLAHTPEIIKEFKVTQEKNLATIKNKE